MFNSNSYYTTKSFKSQQEKIMKKVQIKKNQNSKIIQFLNSIDESIRANNIKDCATYVGITDIEGIAHIVKSNFCRERLCSICAWRRQAKFVAQMLPIMNYISRDYKFIFVTLTVKNVRYETLKQTIDNILYSYYKLTKRRRFKRAWKGICRSLEMTYNSEEHTFHPHLHLLIAVEPSYFKNENYISYEYLKSEWKDCLNIDYEPIIDIRRVDDEEKENATVETLKYALKPTQEEEALKAFFYIMKGRRLVSFTGVFAKTRKLFKYSDFENQLNDDVKQENNVKRTYNLYKFDVTGGVYTFYKTLELD